MTSTETTHAEPIQVVGEPSRFRPEIAHSWMGLRRLRWRMTTWLAWILRACLGPRHADRTGILMYHRVSPIPPHVSPPTWNVPPLVLRSQLTGLLKRGFLARSLHELLNVHQTSEPNPGRSFVVTFDDGYENVYRHAFPILCELQVPATIFLATRYLNGIDPFPCDDWTAAGNPSLPADSWRPLTLAQCQEMQASGLISFGSHTHTHEDFRGRPEAFRSDTNMSLQFLRDYLSVEDPPFAYPFGAIDESLRNACRSMGIACTLSTRAVPVDARLDPADWGRLEVSERDSAADLAVRLDGWYGSVDAVWKRTLRSFVHPIVTFQQLCANAGFLAVLDQGIVSGASFFTAFLVSRGSPAELAAYYLAFRVLWIGRTFQHHLIAFPMKILAQQLPRETIAAYLGSTVIHQGFLAAACGGCVLLLRFLTRWQGDVNDRLNPTLLMLALAIPFYLAREYARQFSFAQQRPGRAVIMDALTAAVQITAMIVLLQFRPLTARAAFGFIAMASLFGSLEWLYLCRRWIRWEGSRFLPDAWRNWNFGKWTLATDTVSNVMILVLTGMVQAFRGIDETGTLAAAAIPVGLATIFVQGILNIQVPRASQALVQEGPPGLRRQLVRLGLSMSFAFASLALATWIWGGDIFHIVYGDRYRHGVSIAVASLLSSLVGSLGYVAATGLILVGHARSNLGTEILQFILAVTASLILIPQYGAMGVPFATTLCVAVGGTLRWIQLERTLVLSRSADLLGRDQDGTAL